MSEQLHILSVSRGSWDEYHRINVAVFDSKEKAEKAGEQFLEARKKSIEDMEAKCPVEKSIYMKIEDECDIELLGSLGEKTISDYYSWNYSFSRLKDINNEYRIEPLYINTMDLSQFFDDELSD